MKLLRAVWGEWRFLAGRGKGVLVVLFGIPVLYGTLISWLYQRNQALERPVVVVDDDGSAWSRRFALGLDATQEVQVVGRPATLDDAFAALRRGDAEALVYLPADFSRDLKSGGQARVKLWVNGANLLTYSQSYPAVTSVVTSLNEDVGRRYFQSRGLATSLADRRVMPIVRDERFLFHPDLSYGDFLVPGVLGVALMQTLLISLAFSVGLGREVGAFPARGPGTAAGVAGKALAQFPLVLAGGAFLVFVLFPTFGWTDTSPGATFGLFAALAAAVLPMAVAVAALIPDRWAALQLLMFLSAPVFMMSGFAWPADQMPSYLQGIASAIPLTPALQALRIVTQKGGTLLDLRPFLGWMGVIAVAWALVAAGVLAWVGRGRATVDS